MLLCLLIESTILPYPVTLVFNFILFPYLEKRIYFLSFLSGLLLDIFTLRILGLDSFIFLLIILIREIFNKRVRSKNVIYQIIFLILFLGPYSFYFYNLNIYVNISFILISVLILYFSYRIFPYDMKDKRKLVL